MKRNTKRILALLSAATLSMSITACTSESNTPDTNTATAGGKIFSEGTPFSMA